MFNLIFGLVGNPVGVGLLMALGGFIGGFVCGSDNDSSIAHAFQQALKKSEKTLRERSADIAASEKQVDELTAKLEEARNVSNSKTPAAVCIPAGDEWLRKH